MTSSEQGSESRPSAEDVAAALERAAAIPLTSPEVRGLASAVPPAILEAAFDVALRERGPHAATVLAFALASARGGVPAGPLRELLVEVEFELFAPLLVYAEGDIVELVVRLFDDGHLRTERAAQAGFLAVAQFLEGAPPPPRLLSHLRMLGRRNLQPEPMMLVALTALQLDDPFFKEIVADILADYRRKDLESVGSLYLCSANGDPLRYLSERQPLGATSAHTRVRLDRKTGRNDPCPCGSGKKFKKCCEEKESNEPPLSALEEFERLRDHRDPNVRRQLFEALRPSEIARLAPERLTTLEVVQAVRRSADHARWDAAERFADELFTRRDLPGDEKSADGFVVDIVYAAMEAGRVDVVERVLGRISIDARDRSRFDFQIALLRRDPKAIELLESVLAQAIAEDDSGQIVLCAHVLLEHLPSLGILAARGALSPLRPLDNEGLLESMEEARDKRLLPPREPWWEVLDALQKQEDAEARIEHEAKQERLELERLRTRMDDATRRARTVEAELSERLAEMQTLSAERERLNRELAAVRAEERVARLDDLESERVRLRSKIEELKGHVAAGTAERAELRQELARVATDAGERRNPSDPPVGPRAADGAPDEDELGDGIEAPRIVLVPRFTAAAAHSLEALPRRIAARALRAVGNLAAGDPLEWRRVKRMQAAVDLYSARIDRAHRLLFRFGDHGLEVADVIARRDLDSVVPRRR